MIGRVSLDYWAFNIILLQSLQFLFRFTSHSRSAIWPIRSTSLSFPICTIAAQRHTSPTIQHYFMLLSLLHVTRSDSFIHCILPLLAPFPLAEIRCRTIHHSQPSCCQGDLCQNCTPPYKQGGKTTRNTPYIRTQQGS